MSQTNNQQDRSLPRSRPPFWQRKRYRLALVLVLIILLGGIGIFSINDAISKAQTANLIASVTASATNPAPYSGTLALSDSLRDGTNKSFGWDTDAGCDFANGAYVVSSVSGCFAEGTRNAALSHDVAFQSTMRVKSAGCGTILFSSLSSFYSYTHNFDICTDGSYSIYFSGQNIKRLASGYSSDILKGVNQPNVIAVVARNGDADLYVNYQKVSHIDITYPSYSVEGVIGVSSSQISVNRSPDNSPLPDVIFNDAKIWKL